jgi:cystathionine beta-lyase
MLYDKAYFDQIVDRSNTGSKKWDKYKNSDVIPFWVADMDFATPNFILRSIQERLNHPVMGYSDYEPQLNKSFTKWLLKKFDWEIDPGWITWTPGVVPGLNLAARCLLPDSSILVPTPIYPPFLEIAENANLIGIPAKMKEENFEYSLDFRLMSEKLKPETQAIFISNPQNPTGRSLSSIELDALSKFVLENNLILVSDEIHCDFILNNSCAHLPIIKQCPSLKEQVISLYSTAKTYNIPGLRCAAAVIPNSNLRDRFRKVMTGIVPSVGPLESLASIAAFSDETNWSSELNDYLKTNVTLLKQALGNRMRMPESTYLAWIYIDDLQLDDPEIYFASHGLGISPGYLFGDNRFIRFNFACPRSLLIEGIKRVNIAIGEAEKNKVRPK